MGAIITLALKDLKLLWRDKFAMFWVLMFPLLMALFFGSIFGGGGGGKAKMSLLVVDEDQSEYSRAFVDKISSSDAVKVSVLPLDSAVSKVRRGKATAYLRIIEGAGEFGNLFAADEATLEVGVDPARKAEGAMLQGVIMEAWFSVLQKNFFNPATAGGKIGEQRELVQRDTTLPSGQRKILGEFLGNLEGFMSQMNATAGDFAADSGSGRSESVMSGPKIAFKEVTTQREGPRSSWEITFPQSIMWGLIGVAASFGISIVSERTRGTMIRLQLAPISRAHILAGKGLACLLFCLGVNVFLLGFGHLVFGIRIPDFPLLALAVVSAGICFTGLMMFISVLGKSEEGVAGAGWAIMLVFSMTGGGMVPLMMMPSWMVTISHISPVKWGILAIEGAVWRGFTFSEMMLPAAVLIGFGVVMFTIGAIKFRHTRL